MRVIISGDVRLRVVVCGGLWWCVAGHGGVVCSRVLWGVDNNKLVWLICACVDTNFFLKLV